MYNFPTIVIYLLIQTITARACHDKKKRLGGEIEALLQIDAEIMPHFPNRIKKGCIYKEKGFLV